MSKAYMIFDLQFGSTGKGLLAGYLAKKEKPDTVVTAWGPNAGHTYINEDGRVFVHRMLANGVVSPNLQAVLIGPGSVIDLKCLKEEITSCADLLGGKLLVIHPNAVIVTEEHRQIETRNVKIGSTMKGTGAAVISRIERDLDKSPLARDNIPIDFYDKMSFLEIDFHCDARTYIDQLLLSQIIQIEGAQGYSLSMHSEFWPYVTSRDVTPAQVLADCAIPYSIKPEVYGTMRTYPIRVADRYDDDGTKIGTSGPCYLDQREIDWGDIGVKPELTTVTKLPRRVFTFSHQQFREAMTQCSPTKLFLNFVNYLDAESYLDLVSWIEDEYCLADMIDWVGVGPHHQSIIDFNDFDPMMLERGNE